MTSRFRVLGHSQSSYSDGLVALGNQLVFISGQVALDSAGAVLDAGDLDSQTRRVFEQLERLLNDAGGSLEDVVRLTAYLTDMSRYAEYANVRKEVFQPPYPTSTAIEVKGLVVPGLLVEVDAIALVGTVSDEPPLA